MFRTKVRWEQAGHIVPGRCLQCENEGGEEEEIPMH